MRLSFRLSVVKDRRKNKKKVRGGRRSIVKADSKSATATTTCWEIPEEILVEILVRLPADSLMRFKCVSRRWSSLISSRYFTNYFFKFSSLSSRRRVCMYMVEKVCCYKFNCYMLISSSSSLSSNLDTPTRGLVNCNNLDGTTTSFLQLNPLTSLPVIKYSIFVNAVRGLMCFRMVGEREEIRIINFTTKQFLSLPLEFGHRRRVWNYFGYDSVNDEYKVLSIVSCEEDDKWRRSETQVFVLGAKASWRNTKSHTTSPPPPQRPVQGFSVNINDVLYNGVWSDDINMLMSFDFNSEDFNLIQFPTDSNVNSNRPRSLMHNLMNYQGQVALFDYSRLNTENILDLWVLEDTGNSKWSHKVFALPCDQFRQILDLHDLTFSLCGIKIRGTGRSGEVTLSKRFGSRNKKNTLVIYDLERDCIAKEIVTEPQNQRPGSLETDVWDDVESIMYLEA